MDSVVVVTPLKMVTEPSVYEYVSLIVTSVLAAAALISLRLTRKQIKATNEALSDSTETGKAQRLELQEQHKLRVKQIMPWFQIAPPGYFNYEQLLAFNNEGARANDISIELINLDVQDTPDNGAEPTLLKTSKQTVQSGGRLSITASRENSRDGFWEIINSEFRIIFFDDLGNKYFQTVSFGGTPATNHSVAERTLNITNPLPYANSQRI